MPPRRGPRPHRLGVAARLLASAAIALVALVTVADPAAAHTELESSSPAAGATVSELRTIELRFTRDIEVAASHVWIADGAGFLALGPATPVDGDTASLSVPVPALGDGSYEVTWHVLAADGNPAEGTLAFTIAGSASAAPAPPTTLADPAADAPPDTSLAVPVDATGRPLDGARRLQSLPELSGHGHGPSDLTNAVARGTLDASLATLVGGLAFIAAVWPQGARLVRTRQVLWIAAILAAFASFELAAFQHASATGLSTTEAFAPWHQWEALQFRFGRITLARIALLAASAVLTARLTRGSARSTRSAGWRAATVLVALGLAQTVALLAHSAAPGALAAGARLLHVLAVSVWIGGLVMLLCVVLPRRQVDELLAVLPRFSALATGAVGVLTVGGLVLAVDLVGTAGALPSTSYGRMLLLKVTVVSVLVGAAALSRRHVRSCLRTPERLAADSVVRPLTVWVGTEVALMATVLGVTTLLVSRVPPG